MKIACFWGEARSLDRISFRHEHLMDGFAALGHEPTLVTARAWAGSFGGPVHLVDDLAELERADFWRELAPDLAVGVTWLGKAPILEALAAAGVPRIAIADSDGQVGFAAHPAASWARIGPRQATARERLRAGRYFFRRYLASRAGRDAEDEGYLASARASTAIAFGSREAIAAFRRFLRPRRAVELAARCFVAPFPVPPDFCELPIPEKENRILAVGRWSDTQKDAPLLEQALADFLETGGETAVDIFGSGGETFGKLARRHARVRIHGVQEPTTIRDAMARSRALVLSSRWETGPHAAGEALALGATLVSTPLPNAAGFIDGGRFGTLATRHSPGALAEALRVEERQWDRGRRDPAAISAWWRERLSPEAFCRKLFESAPASARSR
jgi:glycosyltransferase involved in cell wall biosynthesis